MAGGSAVTVIDNLPNALQPWEGELIVERFISVLWPASGRLSDSGISLPGGAVPEVGTGGDRGGFDDQ